ncbi:hypothetical protein ACF0H5_023837 [Mactra antiquata]
MQFMLHNSRYYVNGKKPVIVYAKEYVKSPPVVFLNKDTFGNNLSGQAVVTATDYKILLNGVEQNFLFGEKCDDPFVVVLTRVPKPTQFTVACINKVLMKTWGLTIRDLDTVLHTGAGGKLTG